MPSSVRFGMRPRIAIARSNSSALSPCAAANSGVTLLPPVIRYPERGVPPACGRDGRGPNPPPRSLQRADEAGKEGLPVGAAEERVRRVLGMRHQSEDGAGFVEDASDRAGRAVEIVIIAQLSRGAAITEGDEAVLLEPIERVRIGGIAAVVMRDG